MTNNLETKINENLPALKHDELTKLANEASAVEYGLVSFLNFYLTGMSVFNFGGFSILFGHNEQEKRMSDNSTFQKAKTFTKVTAANIGEPIGTFSYILTEVALGYGLYSLFGGPVGVSTYLGAKAITNYIGYKYYKNQREKHTELKKNYLLEKNDK